MSDNWGMQILRVQRSICFRRAVATELGISRAAVNKHIDALETYGGQFIVKGLSGYKLANPISLIDASRFMQSIDNRCFILMRS